MATNRNLEALLGMVYPNTMRHLQQLIMDAEACSKNYGKTTLFGKDKFQPSVDKFMLTVGVCVHSLVEDQQLDDSKNVEAAMKALDKALSMSKETYSSWPLAFEFWNNWYVQFQNKLMRDRSQPTDGM
jgi:hypothetical protein